MQPRHAPRPLTGSAPAVKTFQILTALLLALGPTWPPAAAVPEELATPEASKPAAAAAAPKAEPPQAPPESPAATETTGAKRPNDDDRLSINAWVSQVVNNFASRSRKTLLNAEEDKATDLAVGFTFWYDLWRGGWPWGDGETNWGADLFGQAIHSSRLLETRCEGDPNDANLMPEECESRDKVSDPNTEFFKLVRDSDTLEWLGGLRVGYEFNEGQTGVYAKWQRGFLRSVEGGDDLIDNNFRGLEIEHLVGPFTGTAFSIGRGRTDLYPRGDRFDRFKIGVELNYTRGIAFGEDADGDELATWFVEGWLDSDSGPGSDDIQIYYGVTLDIPNIFTHLNVGSARATTGGKTGTDGKPPKSKNQLQEEAAREKNDQLREKQRHKEEMKRLKDERKKIKAEVKKWEEEEKPQDGQD